MPCISLERNSVWKAAFFTDHVNGIRLLTYLYPIPMNYRQFELFDPLCMVRTRYSVLWAICSSMCCFSPGWFCSSVITPKPGNIVKRSVPAGRDGPGSLAGSLFLLAVTWLAASLIRSLVADSQISFDVMNFFTLNIYSVVGFVTLCCISIGYFLSASWYSPH